MQVRIRWRFMIVPVGVNVDASSSDEMRTNEFDTEGMRYLAYALVPIVTGGAVYRCARILSSLNTHAQFVIRCAHIGRVVADPIDGQWRVRIWLSVHVATIVRQLQTVLSRAHAVARVHVQGVQ